MKKPRLPRFVLKAIVGIKKRNARTPQSRFSRRLKIAMHKNREQRKETMLLLDRIELTVQDINNSIKKGGLSKSRPSFLVQLNSFRVRLKQLEQNRDILLQSMTRVRSLVAKAKPQSTQAEWLETLGELDGIIRTTGTMMNKIRLALGLMQRTIASFH